MKKTIKVDTDFLRYHRMLVKELDLKVGDEVTFSVKSEEEDQPEGGGHTNPEDPRKPRKPKK